MGEPGAPDICHTNSSNLLELSQDPPRCLLGASFDHSLTIFLFFINFPSIFDKFWTISESPNLQNHEKHMRKQRILLCCTFPLRITQIAFPDPFGTPKSSKIDPETPPGAPKWPQDGVQTVPWTPKMAVQTSPEPSKPPSRPSKIQFWTSARSVVRSSERFTPLFGIQDALQDAQDASKIPS